MTPAPRLNGIGASPASILRRRARELREAGRDIIELSSGNLEFATPDHVVDAARAAMQRGDTRYTDVDGTPELKDAVRAMLQRQGHPAYSSAQITICNGSTQALFSALLATLTDGDEVIVPAPYWAPYLDQTRLAGGTPVIVPCPQNNGFKLRPSDLDAAITPRTRWLILNNPVNPSGAVYTRDDLLGLAEVLRRHPDVWVLADGLYEHIVFGIDRAPSLVEVAPELAPRTLSIGGVAKSYAMMGWRVGWAAGPAVLIRDMIKVQSQTTAGASSISQAAAVAALNGPQLLLQQRATALRERRDLFAGLLNACPGLACTLPQGTFYLLVSCAGAIGKRCPDGKALADDRDLARYLLESADVTVVAGADFGASPAIRVSFAAPDIVLREAGTRIRRACEALQ